MSLVSRFLLAVTLVTSLLVMGCGSDNDFASPSGSAAPGPQGGGSTPLSGFPISGRVLPPQPGFPLSRLEVWNSRSSVPVSESGAFVTSDVAQGGGQLMLVVDAAGQLIYAAFQEDGLQVGPRTTALVMLYFGSGASTIPPNLQLAARQQLSHVAELDALEAAITAALAKDPTGLTTDPTVRAALQAALASMKARGLAGPTNNRMLIQPSNEQSGIAPSERGANQLVVTNSLRRPAWAFVSKVATKADDGPETPLSPPVAVADFEIPAIKGAASFASAAGDAAVLLFGIEGSGPLAGEPITTSPLNLPSEDGVTIKYSLEIVGPGFSAPSPTDTKQQAKLQDLTLHYAGEMTLQFLFNVVLNTPAVGDRIDSLSGQNDFSMVVTDFLKVLLVIAPDLADKAGQGDLNGVLEGMYNAVTSPTSEALILNFLYERAAPAVGLKFGGNDNAKFFTAARKLFAVLNAADLALTSADTAFAAGSLASASRYVQFDVKTLADKVKLTPLAPSLNVDDEQQFTATVPSITLAPNQFLEFHWTCSGNSGTLRAPTGSLINDFTTAQTTGPTYTAEQDGTDTIAVTVTLVELNERTEIGSASTTVTVNGAQLLKNGDFSAGNLSFWTPVADVPVGQFPGLKVETYSISPAENGNFRFILDVPLGSSGHIEQTVTLPDDVISIVLKYRVWGGLQPVSAVVSANGLSDNFVPVFFESSQGVFSGASAEERSLDITSLKGQTVVIRAGGAGSGYNGVGANFDDFELVIVRP